MKSIRIRPWETKIGDRILGTSLVVTGPYTYSELDMGGDVERQRYTIPLFHNDKGHATSIAYAGDSWLSVLRDGAGK
jgi:hypothetical protein